MAENLPRDEQYWIKLIKLNKSFLSWIKRYMEISSDYDFSPVCADYMSHVEKLQQTYPVLDGRSTTIGDSMDTNTIPFSAKSNHQIENSQPTSSLSILPKPFPPVPASKPLTTLSHQPFKSNPISLGPTTSSLGVNSFKYEPPEAANDDEQDEEPPSPEPPKVFEQDALYSVRCKLMLLEKESLKEKGLGQLYIKKSDGKSQLVIRTDNTNGTILLNIRLTKQLPITYRGNGIMLGCTPNPPLDPQNPDNQKPVTFFIKVKNKDVGKELEEKLLEFRD